jgi:hypothetical protein
MVEADHTGETRYGDGRVLFVVGIASTRREGQFIVYMKRTLTENSPVAGGLIDVSVVLIDEAGI